MAKRPITHKKIEKLRRSLRPGLPVYINLIEYLLDRRLAKNKHEALDMLVEGKVMVESHKVGRIQVHDPISGDENDKRWVAQPLLDAKHRSRIVVLK
jgi:hypothetical protein